MKYLSLLLIFISIQLHALTFKSDGTVIKSDGTVVENTKELSTSNSSSSGKGCSARGDITDPVIAPVWEKYQREYQDNSTDKILSNRKTINTFLAWNLNELYIPYRNSNDEKIIDSQFGQKVSMGLVWNWARSKQYVSKSNHILRLSTIDWNYYYEGMEWSKFKGKEEFIQNKKWNHASDWGSTKWVNYFHTDYPDIVADEAKRISKVGFDGVMLDWWHDKHPIEKSLRPSVSKARYKIANTIKDQTSDYFLIIGNTNWEKDISNHNMINGVFLELFAPNNNPKGKHSCREINDMENLLMLHDKELRYPKIIAFEPRMIRFQNNSIYQKLNEHKWWSSTNIGQFHENDLQIIAKRNSDFINEYNFNISKLFTAMSEVIPEHGYLNFSDNWGDNPVGNHRTYYYDFYNIDMGKPISLMTSIMEGVAYKKYERGIIVYNRLPIAVAVQFPSGRVETLEAYSGNFFWDDPQEELENQKLLYN